jgi:hypothetical protein
MITINIKNGPTLTTPFVVGMNAQQALEGAYNNDPQGSFSYALQYYGNTFGYLVCMINETYDSFYSATQQIPFYFWEFIVNGQVSPTGIDNTYLNDNDVITFEFDTYSSSSNLVSTIHEKYKLKTSLKG